MRGTQFIVVLYGRFFHMFIREPVHSSRFVERRPLQNKEQTKQIALTPVEPVCQNATLPVGSPEPLLLTGQTSAAPIGPVIFLPHEKTLQMVGYQDLEICRSPELKSEWSSFLATLVILHHGFSWWSFREQFKAENIYIYKIKQFECVRFFKFSWENPLFFKKLNFKAIWIFEQQYSWIRPHRLEKRGGLNLCTHRLHVRFLLIAWDTISF